jgi:cytidyltransferase-like protein
MKTESHYKNLLIKAYLLQVRDGYFTSLGLARETGKSYGRCSNITTEFISKSLFKKIKPKTMIGTGGKSNLKGFLPSKYVITGKARKTFTITLCGGVFDLLHPGHLAFLEDARNKGDALAVAVARDETVLKRKGRYPNLNEQDRLTVMSKLTMVDLAVLGYPDGYTKTINRIDPDIIFLGYDQDYDIELVKKAIKSLGKKIIVTRSNKHLHGHSTRSIIERIKGS